MFDALIAMDPRVITYGAIFVGIVVVAILIYAGTAVAMGSRSSFKKRLAMVSGKTSGRSVERSGRDVARRREMQSKIQQMEEGQRAKKRRRYQLRQDLAQAGLKITVRQFAITSVGVGIFAAIATYLFGIHVIGAVLVGFAIGMGLPKMVLNYLRKRRLAKFGKQFPDAIDVIVRGVQSGLPVGECLTIIGREAPEPICNEFRDIVENIKLGLTLEDCLKRSLERVPSQELKFFAIVLQIQQQTGGNLAETLSNLSGVMRDRAKMKMKVKAMAAEANTSAMIIGSLPFLITCALALVNPSYIAILFADTLGNIMIAVGLTWMTIGVIVMRQMINFEI